MVAGARGSKTLARIAQHREKEGEPSQHGDTHAARSQCDQRINPRCVGTSPARSLRHQQIEVDAVGQGDEAARTTRRRLGDRRDEGHRRRTRSPRSDSANTTPRARRDDPASRGHACDRVDDSQQLDAIGELLIGVGQQFRHDGPRGSAVRQGRFELLPGDLVDADGEHLSMHEPALPPPARLPRSHPPQASP
jgi:hypothetical protein